MGGAINRVGVDQTAYSERSANWMVSMDGNWDDPRDDDTVIDWVRGAWAEVHDGHQWVTVDPTWGQVYVDATHLKMSEGSRDLAWANVAGDMKMKVVEVKKRKR